MTFIDLEHHIDAELRGLREYLDAKIDGIDQATKLAATMMERRLDGMNEFRETLKDQASRFATRAEMDEVKDRIEADLRVLRESRALLEGKASQKSVTAVMVVSAIGFVISVLGIMLRLMGE